MHSNQNQNWITPGSSRPNNNNTNTEDGEHEETHEESTYKESCLMPSFAPYFASLPSKFDTIPLWVFKSNTLNTPYKRAFKDVYQDFSSCCFTPSLITKVTVSLNRYENDLTVVKNVLVCYLVITHIHAFIISLICSFTLSEYFTAGRRIKNHLLRRRLSVGLVN